MFAFSISCFLPPHIFRENEWELDAVKKRFYWRPLTQQALLPTLLMRLHSEWFQLINRLSNCWFLVVSIGAVFIKTNTNPLFLFRCFFFIRLIIITSLRNSVPFKNCWEAGKILNFSQRSLFITIAFIFANIVRQPAETGWDKGKKK